MDLSRSAPFLNVRVFFCFNSEFYDREQNTIFLLRLSRPQAPFSVKKHVFGPGTLPQAFLFVKKLRSVLERCRRRLFLLKKLLFSAGALPQALFFCEKMFFCAGTLPQAPLFFI